MDPKSITIFIIDDDESVRRSLHRLIKVAGFKTMTFGSATEFIESGRYLNTGILILDVRMPVMSGLDLQQRLRELGSKLPIIFITAHEKHRIRQKALNAGAVDFLLKPLEKNVLLDAIQRALSNDTSLGKLVVTK